MQSGGIQSFFVLFVVRKPFIEITLATFNRPAFFWYTYTFDLKYTILTLVASHSSFSLTLD